MGERYFDSGQRPPPPPMHMPQQGMGYNNAHASHPYGVALLAPQPLEPILVAPLGHLDGWALHPGSLDEDKDKWQTVGRSHLVKSQPDLNSYVRQDNTSKGLTVEMYQSGRGNIRGMKRMHVDQLLLARNMSELDQRFAWELAAVKPFYRNTSGVLSTFMSNGSKLEITQIRVIMRKVPQDHAQPQAAYPPSFGQGAHLNHQHMHPPANHFAGHGPQHVQPMNHHFNGHPGGAPRAPSPDEIVAIEDPHMNRPPSRGHQQHFGGGHGGGGGGGGHGGGGGFGGGGKQGGMGGGKKNDHGGGFSPAMVSLGSVDKGHKGSKGGHRDSDEDDHQSRRKSSHGRPPSPMIEIPDGPWGKRRSVFDESEGTDYSASDGSYRAATPPTSYSGSLYSGGHVRGKSGSFKKNLREHDHRRKSSSDHDGFLLVDKHSRRNSKRGSHGYRHRRRDDSLERDSRSPSPSSKKRLDDRPHRDRVEQLQNNYRRDKELQRLDEQIENLKLESELRRDYEADIDYKIQLALREERLQQLENERGYGPRYPPTRPLPERRVTDRGGYGLKGRRRYDNDLGW